MKKQFFAKYIVVPDGKITDGCMALKPAFDYIGMFDQKIRQEPYVERVTQFEIDYDDISNYQKVKLFLCSRDIQIGDICRDPYDISKEMKADSENMWHLTDYKSFKVIGEISPEAIWVKEGDEFDENEIKKMVDLSTTFHPNYEPWIEGRENLGYKCIVFIKGPCGHFH